MSQDTENTEYWLKLKEQIVSWSQELGFQALGVTDLELGAYTPELEAWLAQGLHGTMAYMQKHLALRQAPQKLVPGAIRALMVRMDYLPPQADIVPVLKNPQQGAISRYALGRDYHKLMRKRLQSLALRIEQEIGPFIYRPFADSAPILEKPLSEKAGLGWIGKHTILLNQKAGSWFFLGSLLVSLPLPLDEPVRPRCGSCTRCQDICPTQAIIGAKKLDARRCISYLTIEHQGPIALEFRRALGNRIYGCDDCQLVCPWNRYARHTQEPDFYARQDLTAPKLLELFAWDEAHFLKSLAGSPIRRIGFENWQRNISVALGNAPFDLKIIKALEENLAQVSPLLQEHFTWALKEQRQKGRSLHSKSPAC